MAELRRADLVKDNQVFAGLFLAFLARPFLLHFFIDLQLPIGLRQTLARHLDLAAQSGQRIGELFALPAVIFGKGGVDETRRGRLGGGGLLFADELAIEFLAESD